MFVKANEIVAMGLMISMIIVAAPAIAKSRTHPAGHHTHAQAQAQAAGDAFASGVMSGNREAAIRACSVKAKQWSQYAWGVTELHKYRDCMYERGQPE